MRKRLRAVVDRWVMSTIIRVVGLTTRRRWVNGEVLEALEQEGRNYVLGIWHNNLVYFTYVLRRRGLTALVSRSRDGETIAHILGKYGFLLARGSTSDGSFGALRDVYRALTEGRNAAITPDGPRGPRYKVQDGMVALARRTGVPIVPLAFSAPRPIEFGSWDRMKLPRPFTTAVVYVGEPLEAAGERADEEAIRLRVERAMRQAVVKADALAGGTLAQREPLLAEVVEPHPPGRA